MTLTACRVSRSVRVTILAVVALSVAAWGGVAAASSSAKRSPILIGILGPLSGPAADLGYADLNGARLRVNEINKKGGIHGRPLQLVPIDDKCDPTTAVTAAQKLVLQDHVVAILGPACSGNVAAVEQFTNPQKVPILMTGTVDTLTGPQLPYVWRISGNGSGELIGLLDYVTKHFHRIAIIHDNLAFGQTTDQEMKAALTKYSASPVADVSYTSGTVDVTPQLIDIKQAKPDVVYWFGVGSDLSTVRKGMTTLGMGSIPMFGNKGITPSAVRIAGASLNGYTFGGDVDGCKKATQVFLKKYFEVYHVDMVNPTEPTPYYAGVSILAAALNKTNGTGGTKLNTVFMSGVKYDGPEGRSPGIIWNAKKHDGLNPNQNAAWTIQSGKFVPFGGCGG